MAINIKNDYPEFRITDTLHQLVDRLNQLNGIIDSNTRLFDSAVDNILSVVDSQGEGIISDSNLEINALAGTVLLQSDKNFDIISGENLTLSAAKTVTIDAGEKLLLNTDSGEILLRYQGSQFGALKRSATDNELQIWSGTAPAINFDSALNAEFSGAITMPSSGVGSPQTNSKTIHGAINELLSYQDSDHSLLESRMDAVEPEVVDLRSDLTSLSSSVDLLDSFVTNQNLLNISDRLTTIEEQIVLINDRLNILEIFT